jgi:hypothetical protein
MLLHVQVRQGLAAETRHDERTQRMRQASKTRLAAGDTRTPTAFRAVGVISPEGAVLGGLLPRNLYLWLSGPKVNNSSNFEGSMRGTSTAAECLAAPVAEDHGAQVAPATPLLRPSLQEMKD